MMTTFADKLLAKAQQLEADAAALRRAAEVMNGHEIAGKQHGMRATMAGAIKLRARQQPEANGNGNGHGALPERGNRDASTVLTLLTEVLRTGPQRNSDLVQHLAAHGVPITSGGVLYLLRKLGTAKRTGKGTLTRWQLRDEPRAQPDTPEALSPYATTQARRAAKVDQIVAILQAAGKPMKVRDLAAAARDQGITSLTGIAGLVRKGLLASRGQGAKRTYRLAAGSHDTR